MERGLFTYQEITEQPQAWEDARLAFSSEQQALLRGWEKGRFKRVLFTGCGSTHYLAQTAALMLEAQTGVPASAYPSSEILLFPDRVLQGAADSLLVTISRSGTTSETLAAQQAFRRHGGRANWTITCYPESPLAVESDLVLPTVAAQEKSVAQTKSFTSMLLMAQLLAAALAGEDIAITEDLPAMGEQIIQDTEPLIAELGGRLDFNRLVFLGSNYQYGVANEAMLKMTEMSLSFSSAFHFLEYRHGPMSMATEEALIIGLLSQSRFADEQRVLMEMKEKGAYTLALNPSPAEVDTDWQIELPKQLPAWARPLLYLPPLQLLAYYRAMAKELDPDNPHNLTAVVYLDT
jgi:glucosamine--fructose-6-phosphate aminotransferase (isomerizing)